MANSNSELELTIPNIMEVPLISKGRYRSAYKKFMTWYKKQQINSISENVLLAYFTTLAKKNKATTLWVEYSMLRATINIYNNVDIYKYAKLKAILKSKSIGYKPKKYKNFTSEQMNKFIYEAPNDKFLFAKIVLVVGVTGACHVNELYEMKSTDLKDLGSAVLVEIPNTKNKVARNFTITGHWYQIFKIYNNINNTNKRLYAKRRPHDKTDHNGFFLSYDKGKCILQKVGKHRFGKVGKQIAAYLKLPNPELYVGNDLFKFTTILDSREDMNFGSNSAKNCIEQVSDIIAPISSEQAVADNSMSQEPIIIPSTSQSAVNFEASTSDSFKTIKTYSRKRSSAAPNDDFTSSNYTDTLDSPEGRIRLNKLKTAAPQPQRQRALPTSTIDSSGRPECLLKSATSQSQPLPTSTVVLIGIPGCSQPSTSSSGPPSVETFIKDEPSCSQEEVLDTAPTFELLPEQTEQPLSMATRSKPYTGSSDKVYCRLCLKPAHQTSLTPLSPVDFHHPEKDEALKKKKLEEIEEVNKMLKFCFPFYDSLTFGPVICSSCLARLKLCYEFSTECLKSQQLVEKYADKYCTTERLINLDEMIEKMSDDEKAVPDIPNVSSSRVSRKKRHSNEDSSPAKKQRVDHETQEEDYSSDSSDEETSIIKFEPDDDDSCTLSERLKKETDDDDSCALSKRLKKEPDDDDDAFTEDLPHDTRQSYVIDPNKFDEEIKVESMYIDHPDYIKDEPVDDLFIDNREFNERTNIGIDIRKQQPHFHETKNVPAPVSGQVFSNVGSSLGDSTSDVIK